MKYWAVKIFNSLVRMVGLQTILLFIFNKFIVPRIDAHVEKTPDDNDNRAWDKIKDFIREAIKQYT